MNKKLSTLILAAAALLVSCSQDELQNTVNNNEGMKPMTISVALPDGMSTRAVATDDATDAHCFLQILDGNGTDLDGGYSAVQKMSKTSGGYTATVYLKEDATYDFLFWATSESNASTPADLRNVSYTIGETLVWAGRALDRQWSADGVTCKLEHAVSRITLQTTGNLTVNDLQTLTLAVPSTFTAYNVEEMAPVGTTKQNYTYSFGTINISNASLSNPVAIGHFYALVDGEPQTLTLQYNGSLDNAPKEISNVPLAPNTHVVLSGDVANSGLTSGNITATVDNDWSDDTQNF